MPQPTLNDAELAASYGFAMAVLNSDPELKSLFQKAVQQTYTPQRFQAELRNTKWFQKNGEAWRNAAIQKAADPATYKSKVDQVRVRLGMMAVEMGSRASGRILNQMAESAYMFGWDDNQIRQQLATYVRYTDGQWLGAAAQVAEEAKAYAASMGLGISNDRLGRWMGDIMAGNTTLDNLKSQLLKEAQSAFPHLSDRLAGGETLAEIAEPYRQTMANLLELNPESITMTDPAIKKALASKDEQGKPVLRTLYDFENDIRQDKRWLKTKNAQDAAMETTNRILRDMGLIA